jgi:hypothetical protein
LWAGPGNSKAQRHRTSAARRSSPRIADLGFGRIVDSNKEAPILSVDLVWKRGERKCNAAMRLWRAGAWVPWFNHECHECHEWHWFIHG